jgi:hypothetical protein
LLVEVALYSKFRELSLPHNPQRRSNPPPILSADSNFATEISKRVSSCVYSFRWWNVKVSVERSKGMRNQSWGLDWQRS